MVRSAANAEPRATRFGAPVRRLVLWVGVVLSVAPALWLGVGEGWSGLHYRVGVGPVAAVGVVGLVALGVALRSRAFFFTPLLFPLLFLVAFPLRLADIDLFPEQWIDVGITGWFSFSPAACWRLVGMVSLGMLGLMCGLAFGRFAGGRLRRPGAPGLSLSRRWLIRWTWVWFVATLAVAVMGVEFNIGTLTLFPKALPFHLTGFLVYTRPFLFPFAGLWLFGQALESDHRRVSWLILGMNVVIGAVNIAATLSKGAAFIQLVPYGLVLVATMRRSALARSMLRWTIALALLLAPVSIVGASWYRLYTAQSGTRPSLSELFSGDFRVTDTLGGRSLLRSVYSNTSGRVIGANEAMAVVAMRPLPSLDPLLSVVLGSPGWDRVMSELIERAFAFYDREFASGGTGPATGRAFGLFGFWFLTHSWLTLFLGAAAFGAIAMLLEMLVAARGSAALAAGVAFTTCMFTWEFAIDQLRPLIGNVLVIFVVLGVLARWGRRRAVSTAAAPASGSEALDRVGTGA